MKTKIILILLGVSLLSNIVFSLTLKQQYFTKLGPARTAIILVMLKEINNLRVLHGLTPITKMQALQKVVALHDILDEDWNDTNWDTEFDE